MAEFLATSVVRWLLLIGIDLRRDRLNQNLLTRL